MIKQIKVAISFAFIRIGLLAPVERVNGRQHSSASWTLQLRLHPPLETNFVEIMVARCFEKAAFFNLYLSFQINLVRLVRVNFLILRRSEAQSVETDHAILVPF